MLHKLLDGFTDALLLMSATVIAGVSFGAAALVIAAGVWEMMK